MTRLNFYSGNPLKSNTTLNTEYQNLRYSLVMNLTVMVQMEQTLRLQDSKDLNLKQIYPTLKKHTLSLSSQL